MKNAKKISNDLKYMIFSEIYQRYSEPKTRRKAFTILENAIRCFERMGFDQVTFVTIARESALTAPSLRHYFSNLEEIRLLTMKYVHLMAQKIVLETIGDAENPREILRRYLKGHAVWVISSKTNYRVWLNFLAFGSTRKKERAINTLATENGTRRLCELLETGRTRGDFKHQNDHLCARYIQTFILGWLTACVTQDIEDLEAFSDNMIELCMKTFELA